MSLIGKECDQPLVQATPRLLCCWHTLGRGRGREVFFLDVIINAKCTWVSQLSATCVKHVCVCFFYSGAFDIGGLADTGVTAAPRAG